MFSEKMINTGSYIISGFLNDGNFIGQSNKVNITVNDENIENKNIYVDDVYLNEIAIANNGIYSKYTQFENLLNKINTSSKIKIDKTSKNILSYRFVMVLLLFLLLSEWYIRNKLGLV